MTGVLAGVDDSIRNALLRISLAGEHEGEKGNAAFEKEFWSVHLIVSLPEFPPGFLVLRRR